jgi:Flp pilus assembly protein protease CpaA
MSPPPEYLPLIGLVILAAWIDIRQRRIPNWLTGGLIVSGLVRATVIGGKGALIHSVAGVFGGAGVPLVLFALGALGGGDVKLMAGIGAWVGPMPAFTIYVVQCLAALVLILIQSVLARRTMALLRNTVVLASGMAQRGVGGVARPFTTIDRPLPFAVPTAVALVIVLLDRGWLLG